MAITEKKERFWETAGVVKMSDGKILVFGRAGQVGQELRMLRDLVALGRDQVDLTDPQRCKDAILEIRPDVIINAAAFTSVDDAEEDEETANLVNGAAPKAMAEAALDLGIPLIHISTDYVFNGGGSLPWVPESEAQPLSAYGRSKLLGEARIRSTGCDHVILRTSWVFSQHGKNFAKTMLNLPRSKNKLKIVADQIGGPTFAEDIARACLMIADQFLAGDGKSGTYHFSGAPDTSWSGFARSIFEKTNRPVEVVEIPSSAYPTKAVRPKNSRLECSALAKDYGIERPDWKTGLNKLVAQLEKGQT